MEIDLASRKFINNQALSFKHGVILGFFPDNGPLGYCITLLWIVFATILVQELCSASLF